MAKLPKAREIREMSREEREKLLKELLIEKIKLETKRKQGEQIGSQLRNIRRTIARILTINREEEEKR